MPKILIEESALDSIKRMAQEVQDQRDILLAALIDARSVTNSVSMGRDRRVVRDGCVLFLQTEEWCKWANEEVNEKVFAAIARCKESAKVFE